MTREIEPVPQAVQNVRTAMEALREFQATSDLTIDLARFDAGSNELNRRFLSRFLKILPVEWQTVKDHGNAVSVKDPLDLRPTSAFGLGLRLGEPLYPIYRFSFVIGDCIMPDNPSHTQLLLLRGDDKKLPTPTIDAIEVPTHHWKRTEERRISALQTPPTGEALANTFDHKSSLFVIDPSKSSSEDAGLIVVAEPYKSLLTELFPTNRFKSRDVERMYTPASFGRYPNIERDRGLQSVDFERFGVMGHLELITAAYGVGKAFDAVKAFRSKRIAPHPVETRLGLPDFQGVIERDSAVRLQAPLPPHYA